MVEEGKPAPDFELASDAGETVRLPTCAASRSSSTSIPRTTRPAARRRRAGSATPRASSSARRGRARRQPGRQRSHVKFKEKYDLPFTLLADPDHEVAEEYGVWGEKKYAGKTYMGVERSTFVIDADGNVAKVMRRVKPDTHADDVLAAAAGRSRSALPPQLADAI